MESRECDYCGQAFTLARSDARFCTSKCRVYSARKARRGDALLSNSGVSFPAELVSRDRWVRRAANKRPLTIAGLSASSTNSSTWSSFRVADSSNAGVGLGFVLGDGVGCIDLDHCFAADGSLLPWAAEVVNACPATFMEVSQSGDGLHIFGFLPAGAGRNIRSGGRCVEFYSTGRYIALTGDRFNGSPLSLADLSEVVAVL